MVDMKSWREFVALFTVGTCVEGQMRLWGINIYIYSSPSMSVPHFVEICTLAIFFFASLSIYILIEKTFQMLASSRSLRAATYPPLCRCAAIDCFFVLCGVDEGAQRSFLFRTARAARQPNHGSTAQSVYGTRKHPDNNINININKPSRRVGK